MRPTPFDLDVFSRRSDKKGQFWLSILSLGLSRGQLNPEGGLRQRSRSTVKRAARRGATD
jgi:hypothetical protein